MTRCGAIRFTIVISVGAVLILAGCRTAKIPLTEIEVPVPDIPRSKIPLLSRGAEDLSSAEWSEAFDNMHLRLAQEYPYTIWKGIDWNVLYAEYAPAVAEAAAAEDAQAYYYALRRYLLSVPDGHMRVSEEASYRENAIGGGYGFAATLLDDGRVIAYVVLDDGPAEQVGMAWGAEIMAWNGRPIAEAIALTPTLWADPPPATEAGRRLARYHLFTRAPVGKQARVTFRNPYSETPWVAAMTAVADDYATLSLARFFPQDLGAFDSPVQWETLPSGHGYLRVYFEAATLSTPFPARAFDKAIASFVKKGAPGLIMDLRGNTGGDARLVPAFAGHFVQEPRVLREVLVYDGASDAFVADDEERLEVVPRDPYFGGPIKILVNFGTFGAGEAIAHALSGLPNVEIIGFFDTHGTFGVTGGDIDMPAGISVSYPVGRSVTPDGDCLFEGDAKGRGGVPLDLRFPVTFDVIARVFGDGEDVLLKEAIGRFNGDAAARE